MSSRKTEHASEAVKKEPTPVLDVGPLSLTEDDVPACPCIFVVNVHGRAICSMCGSDTGPYPDRWEQFK